MQINAQKSQVVAFHEDKDAKSARTKPRKVLRAGGCDEQWEAAGSSQPKTAEFAGALRRHLESLVSSVPAQAFAGRRKNKRARKTATAGMSHPPNSARKRATPVGSRGKAPATESEDEESPSDNNSESDFPPPDLGESEYSSSDGEDPDEALFPANFEANKLSIPPGFTIAESGFLSDDHFEIRHDNPQADSLVNRYILYRWVGVGWCVGLIKARRSRKLTRHQTPKGYANFCGLL